MSNAGVTIPQSHPDNTQDMSAMTVPIYLDYAAATPMDPRVAAAMRPYFETQFYNPSAAYLAAKRVREDLEEGRHRIATVIGARQHEIIMTAGATESINLAIRGILNGAGGQVVTSPIEHPAVLQTVMQFDHVFTTVSAQGLVSAEAVETALTPETTLVSIGYVNNELGTVQPLRAIADVIEAERQRRLAAGERRVLWFHTDASQAVGLLDSAVSRLGVDLMTMNAGKCYGPKQTGVLWVRGGIELIPVVYGGGQESGLRSGTENVAGIIGAATAFEIAQVERKTDVARIRQLRDRLQQLIMQSIPDVIINGHLKKRSPHILHISVPGLDGERGVFALDERGVMAATGSACAANKGTRSHVLEAVGMTDSLADGSLRFSLGKMSSEDEIDRAAAIITAVITQERGYSS